MIHHRSQREVWLTKNIVSYLWSFLTNHLGSLVEHNTFLLRLFFKNTSKVKRWQFWSCAQVTPAEPYRHVDVEQLQIEIKHWPSVSSTPAMLRQQVSGLRPRWPTKDSHVKSSSERTALFQHACRRNWRNVCYVEKKRKKKEIKMNVSCE